MTSLDLFRLRSIQAARDGIFRLVQLCSLQVAQYDNVCIKYQILNFNIPIDYADYIIENTGSLDALEAQVAAVWPLLCGILQITDKIS